MRLKGSRQSSSTIGGSCSSACAGGWPSAAAAPRTTNNHQLPTTNHQPLTNHQPEMRVAIVGNSGSGKSTLASQIATAHGVESLDLDTVAWEPEKIAVPRSAEASAAEVAAFCS